MIRITEDEKHARYLAYNRNEQDQFYLWLKKLGLDKLPYELTPYDLVAQGLIEPALRVDLPESYFLNWDNYPECPAHDFELSEEDQWSKFCEIEWGYPFGEQETDWFLHPYDRTGGEGRKFSKRGVSAGTKLPYERKHPNGRPYSLCYLYFSHWQGYQVIDLIDCMKRCEQSIPNLPDAPERIETLRARYPEFKKWADRAIQSVSKKWELHKEVFTWLSFYRTMYGTAAGLTFRGNDTLPAMLDEGARNLAGLLKIQPEDLESGIKDHLLVVFQDWQWAIERGSYRHQKAISQLRKDIYYAVKWLCKLNGETFDTYFEKWRYPDRSQRSWAQLEDALPYEYIETKDHFLRLVPKYLSDFAVYLPEDLHLKGAELKSLVGILWKEHECFRSFCRAFHQLHRYLTIQSGEEIDFRNFALIDYFLVLAIRAEVVLFEVLGGYGDYHSKSLKEILKEYMSIATANGVFCKGINLARSNWQLTDLRNTPADPFKIIQEDMAKACNKPAIRQFAKHLLTFGLMRNYFAHHTYLDEKILEPEVGRFGLVSILVSVLYLSCELKSYSTRSP